MRCPVCGAEMRQTRRGATLRKRGPAYICPADEAETYTDERGHLKRVADAKHSPPRRVWSEGEFYVAWPV